MKAPTFPACTALMLAAALLQAHAGQSAMQARFELSSEIYKNAGYQAPFEHALYLEELAAGAARGLWNESDKEAADKYYEKLFKSFERDALSAAKFGPNAVQTSPRTTLDILLTYPGAALSHLAPGVRFYKQLRTIESVRNASLIALRQSACDYACEIWLAAKTPADLEPALPVLLEAKSTVERDKWRMVLMDTRARRSMPPAFALDPLVINIFDTLSVLGAPTPLLLPDPVANPKGYAKARRDWVALRKIENSFVTAPAINARFLELEARHDTEVAARRNRLQAAMFDEADEKELRALLAEFLALFPFVPQEGFTDNRESSPILRGQSFNYKRLIEREMSRAETKLPDYLQREIDACNWWIKLLEDKSANLAQIGETEILKRLGVLPPLLFQALEKRLLSKTRLFASADFAPLPSPGNDPIPELAAALRHVAGRRKEDIGEQVSSLIANLEKLAAADFTAASSLPINETSEIWQGLASEPKSMDLFILRDRAAKELLARISIGSTAIAPSDAPFETLLRERLDASLQDFAFDLADQLLALDSIFGALDASEHAACQESVRELREAKDIATAGKSEESRQLWRYILYTSPDMNTGSIAARELQKLLH